MNKTEGTQAYIGRKNFSKLALNFPVNTFFLKIYCHCFEFLIVFKTLIKEIISFRIYFGDFVPVLS